MSKEIIIVLVVLAAIGALTGVAYKKGYDSCKADHAAAIQALEKTMSIIKETDRAEIEQIRENAERLVAQSRAKVGQLIKENKELRDWWNTAVPAGAVEFAYGLSDNSSGQVPGRHRTTAEGGSTERSPAGS